MGITKTFISSENVATITCPKCSKSRNLPVDKYRNKRHTIKIRCSCGHFFSVQLDFRKHYRKETNLDGTYVMVPPAVGSGRLSVLNISRTGVGFTAGFAIQGSHSIVVGQKMSITFKLDNKKQTTIEKTIVVRGVKDNYVGGEFDLSSSFEKDLGFYLQP